MVAREELAHALDRIADTLAANPSAVIGMQVHVKTDGRAENVTGLSVNVTGSPGSGSTTGLSISMISDGRNPVDAGLINELRDAANEVRKGHAPKSWIDGLLDRAKALGNKAIDAVVDSAIAAVVANFS